MDRRDAATTDLWRRAGWLLVVLVAVRGVVLMAVVPPFEGWDEYQHLAYVDHMATTGARPVLGVAQVSPGVLRATVAWPQSTAALGDGLGALGGVGYDTFWADHDPGAGQPPPAPRPGSKPLYQAQHGPLYYRLVGPLYRALGGLDDPRTAVAGLRALNLVFTTLSVALVLAILRRLGGSDRAAVVLALPLAAHPLFLLNGVRVANDALGLLLATLAIGLGLDLARAGSGRRGVFRAALLGLALGLAVRAKATNLALLPFVGLAWCVHVWRHRSQAAMGAGLALAAAFTLVEAPELAFNLAHYGVPTPMQEALLNRDRGRTSSDLVRTAGTFRWGTELARLWTRELYFKGGWSFLRTHPTATWSYQILIRLGLLGWGVWAARGLLGRRRSRPEDPGGPPWPPPSTLWLLAAVVLGYSTALGYHMVQSRLAWGVATTCPWYAAPALPWFLALVAMGGAGWLPRRLDATAAWLLALVGLAGELAGLAGMMAPTYAGLDAPWPVILARLARLQPVALGTPTLLLALAAECGVIVLLMLTWYDGRRVARCRAAGQPAPAPWGRSVAGRAALADRGVGVARRGEDRP